MASVVAQGSHVDTASYLGFSSRASTELPPDPNGPDDMLQVNSMETTRDPTETVSGEADAAVMVADDKGLTNQGSGDISAARGKGVCAAACQGWERHCWCVLCSCPPPSR